MTHIDKNAAAKKIQTLLNTKLKDIMPDVPSTGILYYHFHDNNEEELSRIAKDPEAYFGDFDERMLGNHEQWDTATVRDYLYAQLHHRLHMPIDTEEGFDALSKMAQGPTSLGDMQKIFTHAYREYKFVYPERDSQTHAGNVLLLGQCLKQLDTLAKDKSSLPQADRVRGTYQMVKGWLADKKKTEWAERRDLEDGAVMRRLAFHKVHVGSAIYNAGSVEEAKKITGDAVSDDLLEKYFNSGLLEMDAIEKEISQQLIANAPDDHPMLEAKRAECAQHADETKNGEVRLLQHIQTSLEEIAADLRISGLDRDIQRG